MPELNWRDAIIKVLGESPEAMHYTDIAEAITNQELRTNLGATPSALVNSVISTSLKNDRDASPFIRVDKARYWLRAKVSAHGEDAENGPVAEAAGVAAGTGVINAFGMYWTRGQVLWSTTPKLLGQQQAGSTVDFCNQKGVYLLHDGRSVIYVGRTTDQTLGMRLRQHTSDRLNGRWDRFSWFGVFPVDEQSEALNTRANLQFDLSMLIATLLIEGLEPPQNRKRGDDFRAVEFLQVQDPELKKSEILALMESIKQKL